MTHNFTRIFLTIATVFALGGEHVCRVETPEEATTIGRKLGGIEKASTFLKLLKDTDESKNLLFSTNGTTTVFVPTNQAFEKLPKERLAALTDPANKQYLERVLTYHAAHNTRIDRYVLRRIGFLRSGLGQFLKVTPDRSGDVITVDGAAIEEYDLACSNGVIHFIDTVLDPIELDLFEYLEKDGRFTVLTKLIKRSGQTKLFQNRHDVYTVFAPTDEAFASLPMGTVDALLQPEKLDLLSDVIKTHIAAGTKTVRKIPDVAPLGTPGFDVVNEYGQELVYRSTDGRGTIDNVNIVTADLVTRNGFVHVLDRPLTPKRDSIIIALERNGGFSEFLALARDAGVYDVLGQFQTQVTVFAPTDAAMKSDKLKERLKMLKASDNRERLRAVLLRHVISGRILTTNAIDYQRLTSQIDARADLVREGAKRTIQGVQIVETDNRTYTHKHQATRFAMLRRLVYCGECGSLVLPAWTNNHGREYRYYTCSKKVKTGYKKCSLPSLPAGELEKIVVEQLRSLLRHPDVIAHTFREVCASSQSGPDATTVSRLEELRGRRHQAEQAARSLLNLNDPEGPFVQSELKRLNGEMKLLGHSIRGLESVPNSTRTIELSEVTDALQRLDPVWEVLYPEEQSRVLELLVESVTVCRHQSAALPEGHSGLLGRATANIDRGGLSASPHRCKPHSSVSSERATPLAVASGPRSFCLRTNDTPTGRMCHLFIPLPPGIFAKTSRSSEIAKMPRFAGFLSTGRVWGSSRGLEPLAPI